MLDAHWTSESVSPVFDLSATDKQLSLSCMDDRFSTTLPPLKVRYGTVRTPDLHILGGGPAGLSTGYYAKRQGSSFVILEAGETVGGNARTLQHGEFLFDTCAHRFHDKDEQSTRDVQALLGNDLLLAEKPSQIVFGTRRIDFPLSPLNLVSRLGLRMTTAGVRDFLREQFRHLPADYSFEDIAIHRYGRTIAQAFLLDYSAKLWGAAADQLSPAVSGQRLKGLDLQTFFIETLSGKRRKTRHLDGQFYYPRWGIGQLMDRLAGACGIGSIRLQSRVTRVHHDETRIQSVEINGRERTDVQRVVSTLPLSFLTQAMDPLPPESVLLEAKRLRFRHVMLVVLCVNRERISENASLYFPEAAIPFTRAYEPKNRSDVLAPADKTSLAVEIPCGTDDPVWKCASDDLARTVAATLETKRLIRADEVFDAAVYCIPYAYPLLEIGYETAVSNLRDYFSRFDNLHFVGRSAEFSYLHIHDLMRHSRILMTELAEANVHSSH
jgi:protoporphyrinogen oxidase